ncbi:MAG: tRNA lysidine(34) synthetase TilS, partial [Acidobacteriales bacterium]|nr:tRNA lysidine(34) synthetase TilS [Terriglobales bacterium]
DQAETVLMRVVRGAGSRGLAGIYPRLAVEDNDLMPANVADCRPPKKSIVRPLLQATRSELEGYLAELRQEWREDSSNRDLRHARNRVRHGILPRLERNLNRGARQSLADTAEIARAEEEYWAGEVSRLMPQLWNRQNAVLNLASLKPLAIALQRRIVRRAAESLGLRLSFRQGEEILEMTSAETVTTEATPAKSLELPQGRRVIRDKSELRFEVPRPAELTGRDYSYRLPVPGHIEVPEASAYFEAVLILPTEARSGAGYNREQLLDATHLGTELVVRNWRPGDRFWPAHTKSSTKVKELLQDRHLAGRERKLWPVVTSGDQIIWMRGFPVPQQCMSREGAKALLIRESPMSEMPYE